MTDGDPPPLAPAPTPADTSNNTPVIADSSTMDSAPPAPSSPADSEKTVIARTRPRKMVALPGSGAAVFSTDGGRLPHRNPPMPPPPVVVRSDMVQGVVDFANYWRWKRPDFYDCFFPQSGWTIADLWDNADIHLESPDFLEEVLYFIERDNHVRATNFGLEWCRRNHDMVNKLGADVTALCDQDDPTTIVDEFFTDEELGQFPHHFLFRVLYILRYSMRVYMEKYYPVQNIGSAEPLTRTESLPPVEEEHAATTEPKQQPIPMVVSSRPQSAYVGQLFSTPGPMPPVPNGPPGQQPSFAPAQQPRLVLQGDRMPMGHPAAAMMPGHVAGQPRQTKRSNRSESNPFAQAPQMHGWGENSRMPSGEHMRHPSGPVPNGAGHRYGPPISMGPHNGAQFPPNVPMTSPPMHHGQMQYPPMMAQNGMFSPPGPPPPQLHDPAYQQFGPPVSGPRGGPFADMANSLQYPPPRGTDARGAQRRSSQSVKQPGLYNPYGAERPDKAGFATTTGPRKASRGNYPNNMGRRKYSSGAFDRATSYASDISENTTKPSSGHYADGSQSRTTHYEIDTKITEDREFGCGPNFIGSQNTTVYQLYIKYMPADTPPNEIQARFEACTGVVPTLVDVRHMAEKHQPSAAIVSFATTDDARKALNGTVTIGGTTCQISVARRYFQTMSKHPRGPFQDSYRSTDIASIPPKSGPYSPQDARSDLPHANKQQQPDPPATRGSPEARKAKKSVPAKKPNAARNDQNTGDQGSEGSSTKSDAKANVGAGSEKHVKSGKGTDTYASNAVITKTSDTKSESVFEDTPTISPRLETVAEEDAAKPSDVDQASRDDSVQVTPSSISESIPADAHAPLLISPTKVTLPPPAETEKTHATSQDGAVAEEDSAIDVSKAEDVAAVPSAQDEAHSDDDQKHDLSFHSAQESQPDGGEEAQKDPGLDDAPIEQEVSIVEATDDARPEVQQQTPAELQTKDEVPKEDATVSQEQQEKDTTPGSAKPAAESGKKHGAQQTESLNPYSKAYRQQQKKEKQAKKKEKKKGKADASSRDQPAGVKENEKAPEANSSEVAQSDVPDETPSKNDQVDKTQEDQTSEVVQETGKVTLNQSGGSLDPTLDPHEVPSREKTDPKASLGATTAAPSVRFADSNSSHAQIQGQGKKAKSRPASIAVPSIDFLKRKSSSTSAGTPPHTAYFSVASHSSEKDSEKDTSNGASEALQDIKAPIDVSAPHESASIASSPTLRGTSPPPMSVSPPAKEFHTPLQTPTALGTAHSEAAKKKKKKTSKKKKKAEGKAEDNASVVKDDSFDAQFSQINNPQSGYYSLRGSDLPASETLERKEDKPKGVIHQMRQYLQEKKSSLSRVSGDTWSRDHRKPVPGLTPEESGRIIDQLPTQKETVHRYVVEEMEKNKVPKAGVIPHFGE